MKRLDELMPDEVKLTVLLTDGRELFGVYDYMSAAERVIQAREWPGFKDYRVEGPTAQLVKAIVKRKTGMA